MGIASIRNAVFDSFHNTAEPEVESNGCASSTQIHRRIIEIFWKKISLDLFDALVKLIMTDRSDSFLHIQFKTVLMTGTGSLR